MKTSDSQGLEVDGPTRSTGCRLPEEAHGGVKHLALKTATIRDGRAPRLFPGSQVPGPRLIWLVNMEGINKGESFLRTIIFGIRKNTSLCVVCRSRKPSGNQLVRKRGRKQRGMFSSLSSKSASAVPPLHSQIP